LGFTVDFLAQNATISNFSLSRNPAHGNCDARGEDQKHLDAEVRVFGSFDGLHFHVDSLSNAVVQSDDQAGTQGMN